MQEPLCKICGKCLSNEKAIAKELKRLDKIISRMKG